MNDNHPYLTTLAVGISWLGTWLGHVTLSNLVLCATLVFTVLQIFILLRKVWRGQA